MYKINKDKIKKFLDVIFELSCILFLIVLPLSLATYFILVYILFGLVYGSLISPLFYTSQLLLISIFINVFSYYKPYYLGSFSIVPEYKQMNKKMKNNQAFVKKYMKTIDKNIKVVFYNSRYINGYVSASFPNQIFISYGSLAFFSEALLKNLVLHEYGHIQHKDNTKFEQVKTAILFIISPILNSLYSRYRELMADKYAIDNGKKYWHTLFAKKMLLLHSKQFPSKGISNNSNNKFSSFLDSHPSRTTRYNFSGKITIKHLLTLFR